MNHSGKRKAKIILSFFAALCCVAILGTHARPQNNDKFRYLTTNDVRNRICPAHEVWQKYEKAKAIIPKPEPPITPVSPQPPPSPPKPVPPIAPVPRPSPSPPKPDPVDLVALVKKANFYDGLSPKLKNQVNTLAIPLGNRIKNLTLEQAYHSVPLFSQQRWTQQQADGTVTLTFVGAGGTGRQHRMRIVFVPNPDNAARPISNATFSVDGEPLDLAATESFLATMYDELKKELEKRGN